MAYKTTTISDLRIYPIKSCRGISLSNTILTRQGLKYDRRWMFIDANQGNKFVTIRQKSQLTLIKTAINTDEQTLQITFPARPESRLEDKTISIPLDPDQDYLKENCSKANVEIWGEETDAYQYTSNTITEAINDFFQSIDSSSSSSSPSIHLVMKGPKPREASGNGSPQHLGRTETVNFPDVLPVLVASQTSLDELNSRLTQRNESPITIERFRPNIILDGDSDQRSLLPWEEDEWRTLRINPPTTLLSSLTTSLMPSSSSPTIDMDVSARCARCHVPNVDPDTAEQHAKEPWSVLYSYRRVDEGIKYKPCFGMLCCPRSEGYVEVGMKVQVKEVMEAAGGKGRHRYVAGF